MTKKKHAKLHLNSPEMGAEVTLAMMRDHVDSIDRDSVRVYARRWGIDPRGIPKYRLKAMLTLAMWESYQSGLLQF